MLKQKLVEENAITQQDLKLPYDHLLQGDYHNSNIFFDASDNLIYVFDLEKTEMASRILEMIRSMDYVCFNGEYEESNYQSARSYINAYHEIYPYTPEEFLHGLKMYYLTKVHSLWIETEHCLNQNTRVDLFLPIQLSTIKYLSMKLEFLNQQLSPKPSTCII